jgi:hypothetical protein
MTVRRVVTAAPHPASGEREGPAPRAREGERPRLLLALGIALLLAACDALPSPKATPEAAASAGAWSKPGADAAAVDSAYRDCLEAADTVTDKDFNIDQDIAASRGGDLQRSSFAGRSLRDTQQNNRDRTQTILSACMRGQGFAPAR